MFRVSCIYNLSMSQECQSQDVTQIAQTIASECVGARVRMLNRTISRIYDDAIRPHGLKFSQMNILTVVALYGPVQPVDVGRRLSLEKSTLSRNVAVMEKNGWLSSQPGEEGNTRLLQLTPQGRQLLQDAAPDWRKAQNRVTEMLGDRATAELLQAADRVWAEAAS